MEQKTDKELHEEFLEDFKQLLKKYKAEFSIEFQVDGWSHKDVPTVHFGHVGHYSYLEFPSFIDGKED